MRILQVIHYFSPLHGGGSINATYNLSKHLAKRGHEVTIFTTDFELDKGYIQSLDGVHVIPFHCIANIGLMLISPEMKGQLKKEIKNFDIIHMHNFRSYQNIIAHHYAKKYGVPYILQARGSIPRFKTKKELKKLFDIFFGYRILKDASKSIFSTKMELKKCEEDFNIDKNKIEIVPNGIDLSEYSNLPEKGEFRRKYSIIDEEKMILYVGRIHEIKGLDMLVRAFTDLVKELDNVKLIIVGPDDGYISTLKEIVTGLNNDKVLFTGPIFEEDKLEAYVDADVFVLPSKYESFGNVALEACACGTPVIVTNRCGIAEWINSNNAGYVVKYDKEELRNALFKVLSEEEPRVRFGERGRKLVREEFGWDKIVREVEEIYENCIKR
jgi:glycosyltransferase involved in cell wall biosynthesis